MKSAGTIPEGRCFVCLLSSAPLFMRPGATKFEIAASMQKKLLMPPGLDVQTWSKPMMEPSITFEVPPQIRKFAEESVDQTEKAISSFLQSATSSIGAMPVPMTGVAKHALAITEANLQESFAHAKKLINAKDLSEVIRLQSEFLRRQFDLAINQAKQMTAETTAAARDAEIRAVAP